MSLKYLHGIYLFLAKVGRRNNPLHVLDVRRALIYVTEYLPPPPPIPLWKYCKANLLITLRKNQYPLLQKEVALQFNPKQNISDK